MRTIRHLLPIVWLFSSCCVRISEARTCEALGWRSFECHELASLQDLSVDRTQAENWHTLSVRNERTELSIGAEQSALHLAKLVNLDLSHVPLLKLYRRGFSGLETLRHLNISGCGLEQLQSSHFAAESALQELDASHNELTALAKDVFGNLRHLIYANLSHNALRRCELAPQMPLLERLELSNNELTNVSLGECPKLHFLALNDNLLAKLDANIFRGLPDLLELHISGNALGAIELDTFKPLAQLRVLNLSHNVLGSLRAQVFGSVSERVALLQLDLSANNIRLLFDNQFKALGRLQLLDLSQNSIASISASHFVGLAALRKLYLQSNDIIELKAHSFAALSGLDTLDLSHNSIEYLDDEVFGSSTLPRLRKLNLNTNNLKRLHALAFSSLPFLEYLSLGNNELRTLDVRMFSPMRHLQKLHLGHNLLEEISTDVLECLTTVVELLIDNNKLTFLADMNNSFPNLKRVAIEGNPWQCPCFEELEHWLAAKHVTYLRENSLYYSGEKPLCVVTSLDYCVQNVQLVQRIGIVNEFEKAEAQSGDSIEDKDW